MTGIMYLFYFFIKKYVKSHDLLVGTYVFIVNVTNIIMFKFESKRKPII